MKMMSLMVVAVLLAPILCSPSTRTFYLLYTHAKSWNDAKMTCERNAQSLLTEKRDITARMIELFKSHPEWDIYLSKHDNWIGLHRHHGAPSSPYVWHDCSGISSYSNWESGQPDTDGLCVSASWSRGQWKSTPCDIKMPFICEKDAGPCLFDIKRGVKYPDKHSGHFITTSLTRCQELCRATFIGNLECWLLTYYKFNSSCFLHFFSQPLLDPTGIVLDSEQRAEVHIKNCFKAFINVYSVEMSYSSVTPKQGCWIENPSADSSTFTSDVTSSANVVSSLNVLSTVNSVSTLPSDWDVGATRLNLTSHTVSSLDSTSGLQSSSELTHYPHSSTTGYFYGILETVAVSTLERSEVESAPSHPSVAASSDIPWSSTSALGYVSSSTHGIVTFSGTVGTFTRVSKSYSVPTLNPSPVVTTNQLIMPTELPNKVAEISTSGLDRNVVCWCPCSIKIPENLTTEDMKDLAEEKVREIKVDVHNLSSTQRKYISVTDERSSAQGIGVLGVLILSAVFGAILAQDIIAFCKAIWHLWQTNHQPSIKELQKRKAEEIFLDSFSDKRMSKYKMIFDTN